MKTSCLVFALAVLLVVGYANATALTTYSHAQQLKTFQPDGNMCDVCIGFMQTDISLLVNIIVGTYNTTEMQDQEGGVSGRLVALPAQIAPEKCICDAVFCSVRQ